MNNKIEKIRALIEGDYTIGMQLVSEANCWDGSLEYLTTLNMDEFDDYMGSFSPSDLANRIFYGDFNPNDDYFRFNAYGNLESLNEWEMENEIINYSAEIAEAYFKLYEDGHMDPWNDEIIEILEEEC